MEEDNPTEVIGNCHHLHNRQKMDEKKTELFNFNQIMRIPNGEVDLNAISMKKETQEYDVNANDVNAYELGEKTLTEKEIKKERRKIWKNVIMLGVNMCLLFTAFNAMSQLQSSLHTEEGLGVITQVSLVSSNSFIKCKT